MTYDTYLASPLLIFSLLSFCSPFHCQCQGGVKGKPRGSQGGAKGKSRGSVSINMTDMYMRPTNHMHSCAGTTCTHAREPHALMHGNHMHSCTGTTFHGLCMYYDLEHHASANTNKMADSTSITSSEYRGNLVC